MTGNIFSLPSKAGYTIEYYYIVLMHVNFEYLWSAVVRKTTVWIECIWDKASLCWQRGEITQLRFQSFPLSLKLPSKFYVISPFSNWNAWNGKGNFYRTRVRSLGMLVSNSLTNWLLFSKLDWCGPGVWRCQLKTCWGCYCCSCWCWGSCWQQFVADLGPDVWS